MSAPGLRAWVKWLCGCGGSCASLGMALGDLRRRSGCRRQPRREPNGL